MSTHEQIAREIKQNWCAAAVYLETSEGLRTMNTKYSDVLVTFEKSPRRLPDFSRMALSMELNSACERLYSLDERLRGGNAALRRVAYPAGKTQYMHVYLRDAVAHSEPLPGEQEEWESRQKYLRTVTLRTSYLAVQEAHQEMRDRIMKQFSDVRDLAQWFEKEAPIWVRRIQERRFQFESMRNSTRR